MQAVSETRIPTRLDAPHNSRIVVWAGPAIILMAAMAVRLPFYIGTSYPLNDGGMFAAMVDNLAQSHYALPYTTTYNFEHIPFCYPPLGFYFGAFAQAVTGASTLEILRWLPLAFNLGTVLAFYGLARQLLRVPFAAFCAGLIYAVLPRSAEWLTMGGGLTRAPAELFVVLAVWWFLRAGEMGRGWAVAAGIMTGSAALTHLEAGILAAESLFVFAVFSRPFTKARIANLFISGVATVCVVAPWLLWMIARHGVGPYLAAFDTRGALGSTSVALPAWASAFWLVASALMWLLWQPPLAMWVLATDLCVSRSAPTHTVIMYALLAALLLKLFCQALWPQVAHRTAVATACLLAIAVSAYYIPRHWSPQNRLQNLIRDTRATLMPGNVAAMRWVSHNTAAGTRFFVFSQRIDPWFADLFSEWFPYLADRQSVYTAQGKEWLPRHAFQTAVAHSTVCRQVDSRAQFYSALGPSNFSGMFLVGPYDVEHAHCAALLRALPGMRLVYLSGPNEVYLRQP